MFAQRWLAPSIWMTTAWWSSPVEQGGGDDGVAEQLAPFREAAIGGGDHGALLVAGVDELEEQIGAVGVDGDVADLVDDGQRACG